MQGTPGLVQQCSSITRDSGYLCLSILPPSRYWQHLHSWMQREWHVCVQVCDLTGQGHKQEGKGQKKVGFSSCKQSPISEDNLLGNPRQTSLCIPLARIGQKATPRPMTDKDEEHSDGSRFIPSAAEIILSVGVFPSPLSLTLSPSFYVLASFSNLSF